MSTNKSEDRVKKLFSDIERLKEDSFADGANQAAGYATVPSAKGEAGAPQTVVANENEAMRRELEALRARVAELEQQLLNATEPVPAQAVTSAAVSAPLLYEKEQVGFAFTGERVEPLQVSTLSGFDAVRALYAPLTQTGKPIGTLLAEPSIQRDWTPEDESLTSAVAQRMSLQIQNLRLLDAAERARVEALAATRRFAHESWESYLDAIHQREQIGYLYDQDGVVPYSSTSTSIEADFEESVSVLEEQVGQLFLKPDPARPLTDEDKFLVSSVARQISQQVESLRLISEASRARAEAEEATRRLTRDSWKDYTERKEDALLGFVYDSNQVVPLTEAPTEIGVSQPLMVRGEAIGELGVMGWDQIPPEAAQIMDAIARQASIHLETLRLNEELQKRAQELQELDRLKSSFLANMSHELRTPLNSILGFSDVMLEGIDGPLTEYMDNDLRLIQKNGKHLLSLINDVLDMAKIESGRMNLHPEKFRLQDVLDETISITSTLANDKNLALVIEPDSDKEVEVVADVTRIRQVMINLVNNSIKFTEKGFVSMRVDRLDAEKVLIVVRDTGIGIPVSHLEIVFQEFAQVDTSTTRKVGGTGLGLPISRRLVEMHGGRMWAESTGVAGEGSRFCVELPLVAKIENVEKLAK